MMVISLLNYQKDEFMEVIIEQFNASALKHMIENSFQVYLEAQNDNGNMRNGTTDISIEFSSAEDENPGQKRPRKDHTSNTNGRTNGLMNGHTNGHTNGIEYEKHMDTPDTAAECDKVREVLTRFIHHMINHSTVKNASTYDQKILRAELKTFLLAHFDQGQDNESFSRQQLSLEQIKVSNTGSAPSRQIIHLVPILFLSCAVRLAEMVLIASK